jgi:hypothetical protein
MRYSAVRNRWCYWYSTNGRQDYYPSRSIKFIPLCSAAFDYYHAIIFVQKTKVKKYADILTEIKNMADNYRDAGVHLSGPAIVANENFIRLQEAVPHIGAVPSHWWHSFTISVIPETKPASLTFA